jgi:hypothetical protein
MGIDMKRIDKYRIFIKIAGIYLIADGMASILYVGLPHGFLYDAPRFIRAVIGLILLFAPGWY